MPIDKLQIESFLELGRQFPILDVRSPGEFLHAHIPGAINLPLFTDEERKIVGTTYKQESREAAIKTGLDFFGPRMRTMVETVEQITAGKYTDGAPRRVLVHCWRGGMRSAGVAWLLDLYGFRVSTLAGGYKSFRHWVLDTFSFPFSFNILGGFTGSGKTYVLNQMKDLGESVIDLENIASHKGSAFGDIGMPDQPTQEMFENLLATELQQTVRRGQEQSAQTTIWLEDESQRIGHINLPPALWSTMRKSPVFFLSIPFEERLKHIISEYGSLDRERMTKSIIRIQKRLGPLETKTALQTLAVDDIESCFRVLLTYYDKQYNKALHNREQVQALLTNIPCKKVDAAVNAATIAKRNQLSY